MRPIYGRSEKQLIIKTTNNMARTVYMCILIVQTSLVQSLLLFWNAWSAFICLQACSGKHWATNQSTG